MAYATGRLSTRSAAVGRASVFGHVPMRGLMRGLGDAWSDYLRGQGGPPGGTIVSPNGDVLHFDSMGALDYANAAPRTDSTVNKDPNSPFYGWTTQQENAFHAAQGETGISTDMTKAAATLQAGQTVTTVSSQVQAASDAQLRAIAQSDPKVAAALLQLAAGGPFRGAQQATWDASNATNLQQDMQDLLAAWITYRDSLDNRSGYTGPLLPKFPPSSWTGPLTSDELAILTALVAKLPADPTRTVAPTTTAPLLMPIDDVTTITDIAPPSTSPLVYLTPAPSSSSAPITNALATAAATDTTGATPILPPQSLTTATGAIASIAKNPLTWVAVGVLALSAGRRRRTRR